jgi:hypothetical protein
MNLNSHNRNTLVSTVSVNDRGTVAMGRGLSQRFIDGRSEVDPVHVRFVKSKAVKCASVHRTASAAAEPRMHAVYALPQDHRGPAAEQPAPALTRWAPLWAALVLSRITRI